MSKLSTCCRMSVAALAVVPLALAASGCGGSSPAASSGAAASSSAAARSAANVPAPAVKVPKYVAADNARKSVAFSPCVHQGKKGWLASGTATNSSKSRRGYSIVIDFVTPKGDTVMDTKVVHVAPVAPKATAHWSALGAAGQPKIVCVIREARATS
jgi:hypothetical protein